MDDLRFGAWDRERLRQIRGLQRRYPDEFASAARCRSDEWRRLRRAGVVVLGAVVLLAAAAAAVRGDERPRLYVFSDGQCPACQQFVTDYDEDRRGLRGLLAAEYAQAVDGRHYQSVTWTRGAGWDRPPVAAAMGRATGLVKIESWPTFWVEGATEVMEGYGIGPLREYLERHRRRPGPPAEIYERADLPPPDPGEDPEVFLGPPAAGPVAEAAEPMDWSTVTIVVLLQSQEVSDLRGNLRTAALDQAVGPLERTTRELTDGQAQLTVIAERTQPERYRAVSQAARINVDGVYVLVLVRRLDLGVRGLILNVVERIVGNRLGDRYPLEIVFERVHGAVYSEIAAAVERRESPRGSPGEPEPQWWHGLVALFVGPARRLFERLRG